MIWSCIFQPCDLVRHFPCPAFSVACTCFSDAVAFIASEKSASVCMHKYVVPQMFEHLDILCIKDLHVAEPIIFIVRVGNARSSDHLAIASSKLYIIIPPQAASAAAAAASESTSIDYIADVRLLRNLLQRNLFSVHVCLWGWKVQCAAKSSTPKIFCHFLSNRLEFWHEVSYIYYLFIATENC